VSISVGDITYTVKVNITSLQKAQKAVKDFDATLQKIKKTSTNLKIKVDLVGYSNASKYLKKLSELSKDKKIKINIDNNSIKSANYDLVKIRQKSKTGLNIKVNNAAKVKKDLREIYNLLKNIKKNKNIKINATSVKQNPQNVNVIVGGGNRVQRAREAQTRKEIAFLKKRFALQRMLLQNRKLLVSARETGGIDLNRIKKPLMDSRKELLELNRK